MSKLLSLCISSILIFSIGYAENNISGSEETTENGHCVLCVHQVPNVCSTGNCGPETVTQRIVSEYELPRESYPGSPKSVCIPCDCGNGKPDLGEQCDDGNNVGFDGCTADCKEEICGDGIKQTKNKDGFNEQCDDSVENNKNEPNKCRPGCKLPICGDNITDTEYNEDCDDGVGNGNGLYGCDLSCHKIICNDGKLSGGEVCDGVNFSDQVVKPADMPQAIFDAKTCNSKTCTPEYPPFCGDKVRNGDEQCDGTEYGEKPDNISDAQWALKRCSEVCRYDFGPICGDGILNRSEEQCDGSQFRETPTNIPANIVELRTCNDSCVVDYPGYCGDSKLGEHEVCDPSIPEGQPGYNKDCKNDCTLCTQPDSCGRACGARSYGNPNCCEDVPAPSDSGQSIECRRVSGGVSGQPGSGRIYINGVANGQQCTWWLIYAPTGVTCKNTREVCTDAGKGIEDGPYEVTQTSCKANFNDVASQPACNPATDPLCLSFELSNCDTSTESIKGLYDNGEACEPGSPGCIEVTLTSVSNSTSLVKSCSGSGGEKCTYQIKDKNKLSACKANGTNEIANQATCGIGSVQCSPVTGSSASTCDDWKPTGTTSNSSTTKKYVKAMAPYCSPRTEYRKPRNADCTTTVKTLTGPHEVNYVQCQLVGEVYNKQGQPTGNVCYTQTWQGSTNTVIAVTNIHKFQCLRGKYVVKSNEAWDIYPSRDAIAMLTSAISHEGYEFRGRYIASDSRFTYGDGTTGTDANRQDICWSCALIRYAGCFDPNTLITLSDGTQKKISEVAAGDEVYNPVTKQNVKVKSLLESNEPNPMVLIKAGGKELKVTQTHPVYVSKRGNVIASELKVGDLLVNDQGQEIKIDEVTQLPIDPNQKVINLTIDSGENFDDHILVANGLYSGDLYVQQNLKKDK